MPRLLPTDWRTQAKIFEKFGCRYVRQKGSHLIYYHPNAERIRQSPEFDVGIVGQRIVDKKQAINEVQKRTSIGCALIDVEQRMIRMLIKHALEGNL